MREASDQLSKERDKQVNAFAHAISLGDETRISILTDIFSDCLGEICREDREKMGADFFNSLK